MRKNWLNYITGLIDWQAPSEVISSLRQDLTGGHHSLSYLWHWAHGNRIRRYEPPQIDDTHPPVLLLHGFLGTRGSMSLLEKRLNQDGICAFSFNLGLLNLRDIRASALRIARKVDAILAQVPVRKIDIIGHSMGGLIGLYYVKRLAGHEKVRRLIMIGTPMTGTWSALMGVAILGLMSRGSWQILPRSSFLQELSEGILPPSVEYYTVAAERDWFCPPSATLMPGATRITVPLGHASLVVGEEVYQPLLKILRN